MKKENNNERDILKEIVDGKFKDQYLVYNRKSTDEADNQKNSISYQLTENSRFAGREGLPIALINIKGFCTGGIITEKHSGFKEDDTLSFTTDGLVQYRIDRPKFQKMLELLNKGYFKGVICLCWDRISRNKGDNTIIRKLMRRGIDVRFVYANYDKSSAGALHMDIDEMFSQHHSRVTSEKVTLATRENRRKGICTYRAPIGYLNLGNMDYKPFDVERAPIIREMFDLYATGEWSVSDLARYAQKHGMTTIPMRRRRTQEELLDETLEISDIPKISRPISENSVNRILRNKFYTGRIKDSNGLYIRSASHEPLVDDILFDQVQILLKKKTVSIHYTKKRDLPLRGMLRCAECNRSYTPYMKKGNVYYSSRCQQGCENTFRSFNLDYVANFTKEKIKNMHFTEEELIEMDKRLGTEIALLEERRSREMGQNERQKKKLREDLAYLRSNKLVLLRTGVYTPEVLTQEEDRLDIELHELHTSEQISDEAMHATMKDVVKISELIKNLTQLYIFGKLPEKTEIINSIFSELYVSSKTLKYKARREFEYLENRFNAMGAPLAWISELSRRDNDLKSAIKILERLLRAL